MMATNNNNNIIIINNNNNIVIVVVVKVVQHWRRWKNVSVGVQPTQGNFEGDEQVSNVFMMMMTMTANVE